MGGRRPLPASPATEAVAPGSQSPTRLVERAKLATVPGRAVAPRRRLIHRHGLTVAGIIEVGRDAAGEAGRPSPFASRSSRTVAVRLSRFGERRWWRRHIGLSVKLLGGRNGVDLDLLLMSSAEGLRGRRWFHRAAAPPAATFFSTFTCYEWQGDRVLLGARFVDPDIDGGDPFVAFDAASPDHPVEIDLCVASRRGPWHPVARLRLTAPMAPDLLRFTPAQHDETLRPVGPVNLVRAYVYRWFQRPRRIRRRPPTAG
jgi:hypothetical protein